MIWCCIFHVFVIILSPWYEKRRELFVELVFTDSCLAQLPRPGVISNFIALRCADQQGSEVLAAMVSCYKEVVKAAGDEPAKHSLHKVNNKRWLLFFLCIVIVLRRVAFFCSVTQEMSNIDILWSRDRHRQTPTTTPENTDLIKTTAPPEKCKWNSCRRTTKYL